MARLLGDTLRRVAQGFGGELLGTGLRLRLHPPRQRLELLLRHLLRQRVACGTVRYIYFTLLYCENFTLLYCEPFTLL